jgi:nicotinate-nucleotide pyrophosphorylase (carboxylating)
MLIEVLDEDLLHSVREALVEDIGSGDITAAAIPDTRSVQAAVICREQAVLCGMAWFSAVFAELDSHVLVTWELRDGDVIRPDQIVCRLTGPARAILTGERTALNFLQTLSGTATLAHRHAETVSDLPVTLLDTRKTIPGLRQAQKYAVRTGGCANHRSGLYDGILIKENHINAAGSIREAVSAARTANPGLPIEVEVENTEQINAALEAGAERLLLDNFTREALAAAVRRVGNQAEVEASGGITLENLRETALTGVDFISIGSLTKNLQSIDFSMRFTTAPPSDS